MSTNNASMPLLDTTATTNTTLSNFTRPLSVKRNIPPRSVPFRAIRKAFSSATGMHGLITPSTVQLRQREIRGRRPLPKPRGDKSKVTTGSGEVPQKKEAELPQNLPVEKNHVSTQGQPPIPERPPLENSSTISTENSNLWEGGNGSDGYSNHGVEGNWDTWSHVSEGDLEPPPLPDFDDR